jgi:hypothetical protein
VISPDLVDDAIKQAQFERIGYLAYIIYFAYLLGIYDVNMGKIQVSFIFTTVLSLTAFVYSGRKFCNFLLAAYQFYGTLHLIGQQIRQRETIIQRKTVEVKVEQTPVCSTSVSTNDEEQQTEPEPTTSTIVLQTSQITQPPQSQDRCLNNRSKKVNQAT